VKFVAVTSCPTGIAHSEMAAEALENAAREAGHEIEVEVQGAAGAPPIDTATINAADAAIFAVDAMVREKERFAHLPFVEVRTREAIDKAADIIARAEAAAQAGPADKPVRDTSPTTPPEKETGASRGEEIRRWLMTGVSYMIPFVVAGGILIAAAFAMGGAVEVTEVSIIQDGQIQFAGDVDAPFLTWLGAVFLTIGGQAFGMLVPILAGFIAYAMADRPGIAPGIVGGLIANEIGAGFLGGLIAGLLAGAIVNLLKKIPVKGTIKRMMPILVYPVIGTSPSVRSWSWSSATDRGGQQRPVRLDERPDGIEPDPARDRHRADDGLRHGRTRQQGRLRLRDRRAGRRQPADHGRGDGRGDDPAAGHGAGHRSAPSLYNESEKRAGEAAWVMGASFITEGAIPFAAADPLRVIPSLMAGSAVTGALSLSFNATLNAPHGGIFVVGLIGNAIPYLIAIAIGTVVTTLLVNVLKGLRSEDETAFKLFDVRRGGEVAAHA
jgi:fructose PTS system EIIBC or EIIC component